jgi:hypothetical protein
MRPRWLAWAAFVWNFSSHGFSRIEQIHIMNAESGYSFSPLIIRFLFPYTYEHVCGRKKSLCSRISEDITERPQPLRG